MALLGFKKRFAGQVELRQKKQSIRPGARFKVGQWLQLYTGLRTKQARKLSDVDPRVVEVLPVVIADGFMLVDGQALDAAQRDAMAARDGFENWQEFQAFFAASKGGLPFRGQLVKWDWPL